MNNDSWNVVGSWVIKAGESELIGRYSKFSIEYFALKTGYLWKLAISHKAR